MTYAHILLWMIFIISIISFFSLAPWVPTRTSDLKRIQKLIKLKPKENFLEIWCGTAKVSLYIAKENPESFITGIELSPLFFLISKIKILCSRQKNIRIIYWNAFKKDLSLYEVLYVFWLPETVTEKLFPKLETEMKIWSSTRHFY